MTNILSLRADGVAEEIGFAAEKAEVYVEELFVNREWM